MTIFQRGLKRDVCLLLLNFLHQSTKDSIAGTRESWLTRQNGLAHHHGAAGYQRGPACVIDSGVLRNTQDTTTVTLMMTAVEHIKTQQQRDNNNKTRTRRICDYLGISILWGMKNNVKPYKHTSTGATNTLSKFDCNVLFDWSTNFQCSVVEQLSHMLKWRKILLPPFLQSNFNF